MANLSLLVALSGLLFSATVASAQTFAPVVAYAMPVNSYLVDMAAGDVNNDGKIDLLTVNYNNSTVGLLLGTGTGTFQSVLSFQTYNNNSGIALGDVNKDGNLDVLTTSSAGTYVLVQMGTGTGTFSNQGSYFTGIASGPQGLVAADVNGDTKLDIVVANTGTSTVGVLLGNGNGTFQAMTAYFTGTNSKPSNLAIGDVNGDGKADIVTANGSNSTVGVLLGVGTGTFQAVTTYNAGTNSYPSGVAVVDVNGDGKRDILTANYYDNTVGVLLGTGAGTFQAVTTYPTGSNSGPAALAVTDVNGDGILDLVTADGNNSTAGVLLGTGSGTFRAITTYATGSGSGPGSLAVGDANGDGRPDLFTINSATNTVGVLLNTTIFLPTRAALSGAASTLAPNPARTSATLTATGLPAAQAVQATLLNPLGQEVRRLAVPATAGTATATVLTAGLAAGLYLLHLETVDALGAALGVLPTQRLSVE